MKTKRIFQSFLLLSCITMAANNPFFGSYSTPHGTIPFNNIKTEHYLPAFQEGIKQAKAEVNAIVNNSQKATFENTIVALEKAGELLNKVELAFFNLTSAETNDELDALNQTVSPMLSEYSNWLLLNDKLFDRVKKVYEQKSILNLTPEQNKLLENTFDYFANNGANLSEIEKKTYQELTTRLSVLSVKYSQNVLKATNAWTKLITDESQLIGLSDDVKKMLKSNAEKSGQKGWLLNLKPTTTIPVLKTAENRALRHELWLASNTKCMSGEFDNTQIMIDIANTRLAIANLLGHKCYADYALKRRMAENSNNVYQLLNQLLNAYKPTAQKEYNDVQTYANQLGFTDNVQPWDFSFYSEKLKNERFNINDEILRPYFELENVKKGVWGLAYKLYGITFKKNDSIQVYHPEVEAFDVIDERGNFLAVLYTDFHPRDGKRAGAWMNEFKSQWKNGEEDSRPHITVVMNFTRPTDEKPALLTYDELTTFLHEFGHALHGILTRCTYSSISGTNVYRDFVELPSQIMENWASEKEFLENFAFHYQTGEKIPDTLIQKIKDADNYLAAYACLRQLSFGFLDMAWHTQEKPFEGNAITFEKQAMSQTDILPVQSNTSMSPTFSHIFAGGYAAGYYSYKWAEVLDADAFSVFKAHGIFDKKTASAFRSNILERGGSEHPMVLYKRFRGQEPTIDALLKRNNITK